MNEKTECGWCARWATRRCDYPVAMDLPCGRAMCDYHTHRLGPDMEFCPDHANAHAVAPPAGMIKAVSVLQPWAQLIAIGAKTIETRSWGTAYRGWLGIQASRSFPGQNQMLRNIEPFRTALGGRTLFPCGAVVAIARLTACDPWRSAADTPPEPEASFGNYGPKRMLWRFGEVVELEAPVAARGSLGLWDWTPPDGCFAAAAEFSTKRG